MRSISFGIGRAKTRSFGAHTPVREWGVTVTGRVAELSDNSALSIKGTACEALIALDGATYEYHAAQDVPSAIQESPGGPFVSALELRLRTGDTLTMAEVRTASSPGDQQH